MTTRLLIIICIVVFIAASFMVTVYFYPESFGKEKLIPRGFTYDGTLPEKVMRMINQCNEQDKNPFADYGFERYSNGHYYFDNVICELINVEKGGCIEPIYNEETGLTTCTNHVSYDYPYGETRPEFNKEFCNIIFNEPLAATDTVETKLIVEEYLNICIERGLLDEDDFEKIPYGSYRINGSDGSYTLIEINCFVGQIQKGNECVSILDGKLENEN